MEMVSIFTTNLRRYLQEHNENGRTFTDICREAPFPKGTLGTLTSGRVDNPTYNTAYKLAQALWVPMEAFAVQSKARREQYCGSIRLHIYKTRRSGARRRRWRPVHKFKTARLLTPLQNTPWTAGPHPWPEQIGCCPLTGRPYSVHGANMYNVAAATSKDIAHLIAAAPDMLDALLLAESCPSAMAALDDATAALICGAIAKAKGGDA